MRKNILISSFQETHVANFSKLSLCDVIDGRHLKLVLPASQLSVKHQCAFAGRCKQKVKCDLSCASFQLLLWTLQEVNVKPCFSSVIDTFSVVWPNKVHIQLIKNLLHFHWSNFQTTWAMSLWRLLLFPPVRDLLHLMDFHWKFRLDQWSLYRTLTEFGR